MILIFGFSCNITYAAETSLSIGENKDNIKQVITSVEMEYGIPQGLLSAIAKIESSYRVHALNVNGQQVRAKDKSHAANLVNHHLARGVSNIDIGVMQINYRWHGENFSSVNEMLDPVVNVKYAASLLKELYKQFGNWNEAVRHYHSAKKKYHLGYSRKVIISWLSDGGK